MSYRILRAAKNRFGATNEIGVFEMADRGLAEVPNPSETLLSGRPEDAPGTCVTCAMEGARPILAEIQALIAPTVYSNPKRTSNGLDYNRSAMLMAVLEKRGGLKLSNCDAYLNVVGGLTLDEPSADLAVIIALASSYLDAPVENTLAAIGEVGLSGELRSVQNIGQRRFGDPAPGLPKMCHSSPADGQAAADRWIGIDRSKMWVRRSGRSSENKKQKSVPQ